MIVIVFTTDPNPLVLGFISSVFTVIIRFVASQEISVAVYETSTLKAVVNAAVPPHSSSATYFLSPYVWVLAQLVLSSDRSL